MEALAEEIVHSGLLRIHTDDARNFVHYASSAADHHFSARELSEPALLARTRHIIADTLPGAAGKQGVEEILSRLRQKLKTAGHIPLERELEVARLLVQSCEPVILQLALLEGVALFVSYSHSVADLQPVHFWEAMADTGGLQSLSGDGTAVYVSCGGNPFITKDEQKRFASDGFGALARCMVIAGQELGHYADLKRDAHCHITGRHSAGFRPFAASDAAREARLADLERVAQWKEIVAAYPVMACIRAESAIRFFRENRPKSPRRLLAELRARRLWQRIRRDAATAGHDYITAFPEQLYTPDKPWPRRATLLAACLDDMDFNLAPVADAYRSDDPRTEEAIQCIEALARVPQQVNKWGHDITRLCMPHLYLLYYGTVVPANITAYEALSGKKYSALV
jgi:hypothetical protein